MVLSESEASDDGQSRQQVEELTTILEKASLKKADTIAYSIVGVEKNLDEKDIDKTTDQPIAIEDEHAHVKPTEPADNMPSTQQLLQGQFGVSPPGFAVDDDPGNYVLISVAQPANICDCRKILDELYLKWFRKMASVLCSL